MWQPLFANLALAAVMLVAWSAVGDFVARLGRHQQQLLFGVVMTAGTIGSMMMAFEASPGVYNDLRGRLIAVTGFFGGVPAAVMAAGAALIYRLYLGGAVGSGVLGIMLATATGLVGYTLRRQRRVQYRHLILLAAAVALTGSLVFLTLPAARQAILLPHFWAPTLLGFVATLSLSVLLLHEERQPELSHTNKLFRSMVDALPDCLNIKDVEGRFLAANPATAHLLRASSVEEILGKTDFDFFPAELARQFREDELGGARQREPRQHRAARASSGWITGLAVDAKGAGQKRAGRGSGAHHA
ncbi:LytS/YhcK type 5TM receptor domain-containing protein [Mesorhizobium sp. B2-8-9]|uniref:LytS/YhcK type 5TM receptor domain-containing protein n=1 Tax=Mesorhizobium sp. B2-8-9 TaxID=2589899 RepID=UPI001FEDF65D|nr:LytS/YhcK type 5TM receptor domain-containing protein [Mesorhizobium sp. B2-8-9]